MKYPTQVYISENVFLCVEDHGLMKYDLNKGAFAVAETCLGDQANVLLWIGLLSDQISSKTTQIRRAKFAYKTRYAFRILKRFVLPELRRPPVGFSGENGTLFIEQT